MRKIVYAMLSMSAVGYAAAVGASPADPYDYPYCLQGGGFGLPGDCGYQTYAQCKSAASGRIADCGYNPRMAFGPQATQPTVPTRSHRHSENRY